MVEEAKYFGERVARVETELKYLQRDVSELKEEVEKRMGRIEQQQEKMLELLTEARGMSKLARWLWIVGGGAIGLGVTYWGTIKALFIKVGG